MAREKTRLFDRRTNSTRPIILLATSAAVSCRLSAEECAFQPLFAPAKLSELDLEVSA
jgi:hypothetical protein